MGSFHFLLAFRLHQHSAFSAPELALDGRSPHPDGMNGEHNNQLSRLGISLACPFVFGTVTLRQTPPGIRRNAFSLDFSYSSGFATCIACNLCWAYF